MGGSVVVAVWFSRSAERPPQLGTPRITRIIGDAVALRIVVTGEVGRAKQRVPDVQQLSEVVVRRLAVLIQFGVVCPVGAGELYETL